MGRKCRMKTVYIASPYTKPAGNEQENVDKSFDVAIQLIELGYAPYAPLYSHYLHLRKPQPYDVWMRIDVEYLLRSADCLLRLPGESSGADEEVKLAIENDIPAFYSVEALVEGNKPYEL
jgi:hypothetical protein